MKSRKEVTWLKPSNRQSYFRIDKLATIFEHINATINIRPLESSVDTHPPRTDTLV